LVNTRVLLVAKSEKRLTLLGLAAHPDDLEFMAGGTLANFVRADTRW
jgi:LmbE family N-acetylglucosaminyl deacetylase